MVEEAYPSHKAMFPMKGGGTHTSPHSTTTRFMMKKGAQQITKVEKTTPRTLVVFSSDTVEVCCLGGFGRNGNADRIVFLPFLVSGGFGS